MWEILDPVHYEKCQSRGIDMEGVLCYPALLMQVKVANGGIEVGQKMPHARVHGWPLYLMSLNEGNAIFLFHRTLTDRDFVRMRRLYGIPYPDDNKMAIYDWVESVHRVFRKEVQERGLTILCMEGNA